MVLLLLERMGKDMFWQKLPLILWHTLSPWDPQTIGIALASLESWSWEAERRWPGQRRREWEAEKGENRNVGASYIYFVLSA